MRRGHFFLKLLTLALILLVAACANPADDKPEAVVSDPAVEPAAESTTESATLYTFSHEGSTVGFVGSKVTGSHDGGFNNFNGEFHVTGGTIEGSSVKMMIDTTSLWADDERLTGHLKSPDFFDVEQFPTSTFTSTSIVPLDSEEGSHTVTGNLELHGVTKQISFPADVSMTDGGFSTEAEFSVKRFDFGIEYPGKADDLIRDEVVVKLDLNGSTADPMSDDAMSDDAMAADHGEPAEAASDDAQAH